MSAKISAAKRAAFLRTVGESGNITLSAERAKVSRSWVVLHRGRDAEFDSAVRAAVEQARERLWGAFTLPPLRGAPLPRAGEGLTNWPRAGWRFVGGEEMVVRGAARLTLWGGTSLGLGAVQAEAPGKGLPFMAFTAQLAIPLASDLRTARRRPVNFSGFVRESVATVVPVEVTNLSTDGCCFRATGSFETATIVWLKIAGLGARQARIIWGQDGGFGCEFVSPLQSDVVEQLYENEQRKLRAALQAGEPGFGRAA